MAEKISLDPGVQRRMPAMTPNELKKYFDFLSDGPSKRAGLLVLGLMALTVVGVVWDKLF